MVVLILYQPTKVEQLKGFMADEQTAPELETASDALMEVFKKAEDFDLVLCMYRFKDGGLGYYCNDEDRLTQIGLIELTKGFMLSRSFNDE